MKISKKDAALLSDRERELLQTKGPWKVRDLVKTIERVRALRDKASDLLQRQTIAVRRGKGGQRPIATNERSSAKLDLLEQALAHFRKELDAIDVESAQAVSALRQADSGARAKRSTVGKTTATRASAAAKKPAKPSAPTREQATGAKAVSKKPGARTVEDTRTPAQRRTAVAKRATAPRTPRSSKARQPVARTVAGPGAPQQFSSASRKSPAKNRRG
jgi:hypothetical protein